MSTQLVGYVGETDCCGLNAVNSDPTTWNLAPVTVRFLQKYTPFDVSAQGVTRPQLPGGTSYAPGASFWLPNNQAQMLAGEAALLKALQAVAY